MAEIARGRVSGTDWHSFLIVVVAVWDLKVIYWGIYWNESFQNGVIVGLLMWETV